MLLSPGDAELRAVREAARRFRGAIERAPRKALGISFERFPRGACGDATPLLGTYLLEQGLGPFQYVLGERATRDPDGHPSTESHAWLEAGELLVDITADQFGDYPPVIVRYGRAAPHDSFDARALHTADYRIYDEWTRARLAVVYHTLLRVLSGTAAGKAQPGSSGE